MTHQPRPRCTRCGGSVFLEDGEWRCLSCGREVNPVEPLPGVLPQALQEGKRKRMRGPHHGGLPF